MSKKLPGLQQDLEARLICIYRTVMFYLNFSDEMSAFKLIKLWELKLQRILYCCWVIHCVLVVPFDCVAFYDFFF